MLGATLAEERLIDVVPVAVSSKRTISPATKSVSVPAVSSFQFFGDGMTSVVQLPFTVPVQTGLSPLTVRAMNPAGLLRAAFWREFRPEIGPSAKLPNPLPPSVV